MKAVEEELLEMKDTSELMLDLAYSSLLYHNQDIAEEVFNLEQKVNELQDSISTKILENNEDMDPDKSFILFKMADSIERFADAALDIADVVLRDIELHPVIKESLKDSDEFMVRKEILKGAFLDGKTLEESEMTTKIGMKVIAIRRGDNWSYGPDKEVKLKAGDIIFARGPRESEEQLNKWTRVNL
ncbi:MAG: PhoU family transcriptional regulator [Candidatus Thermoplasmatota archaeon]|nr:PhoU family transcriptional regulator [Candidatus Thermoplasmatota archaeon]MBS3789592.1 PhoU family transcriptional regulator [Candidatus Thermoplasmatota archaeon]